MRALLIAEKPDLMRDIERVYKKMNHPVQIDFAALVGHVVELKKPDEYKAEWGSPWTESVLPIIPTRFEFNVKKQSQKVYSNIVSKIKKGNYDFCINACDSGREGENIFHSFIKSAGINMPVKRLWATDTTDAGFEKALLNLIDESDRSLQRLKISAMYRSVFDWLLGMNLSRAASLKAKRQINLGRVMSPVLAILVKRALEIQQFTPQNYYQIKSNFGSYEGIWFNRNTNDNKLDSLEKAQQIISQLVGESVIKSVNTDRKSVYAPTLHSLLELQKEANKFFGYSATETLTIAQALYENKKLLTYPRTESRHLPKNLGAELSNHVESLQGIPLLEEAVNGILQNNNRISNVINDRKYVDDQKLTDHHAILITQKRANLSELSDKERNIYLLVARRFISIFMPPYVFDKTTIVTESNGHLFKTTGSVVVQKGYSALYDDLNRKNKKDVVLPHVQENDQVELSTAEILTKETTPPEHYNEGSLLQAMANAGQYISDSQLQKILKESAGLGTSATRAGIIEKLVDLGMAERKGKAIYATPFGIDIINSLAGEDIISPELTAKWEEKLRQIEDGSLTPKAFYQDMVNYTHKVVADLLSKNFAIRQTSLGSCPLCGNEVIEGKNYYRCSQYPNPCKLVVAKDYMGAKIGNNDMKKILSGQETRELTFTWKSGNKGKARLVYQNGKLDFVFSNKRKSS